MFVWVWEIHKLVEKSGGIQNFILKLKDLGIDNLCIKFHEGASDTGDGVNFRKDFLKYKDTLKEAQITVGAWGYNYFNNISREVAFISEAIKKADYYIFDPEREVKNKKSQAEDVCSIIRELYPKAKIGYSSYAIPSYHDELPFEVFDRYCDFFSPQTYFQEMNWSVERCIDKMQKDVKKMRLNCNVIPSIQGYNQNQEVYDEFKKMNYEEFGIWSLDFLDEVSEKWIKSLKLDKKTQIKDTKLQVVLKAIKESDENQVNMYEDRKSILEYLGSKPLRIGDRNKLVEILQKNLIESGVKLDIFGIDGDFGYETYRGIAEFQKTKNLKVDSIVGLDTWTEILKNEGEIEVDR